MFFVTNRKIHPKRKGFDVFGETPNLKGPLELRMARVERTDGRWTVELLRDTLTTDQKKEIGAPVSRTAYASDYVAHHLLQRVRGEGRNLLLFVHGFNNDVRTVAERAETLAKLYGVEVVPFTWPANGGGVKGVFDYSSDKIDARASDGALNRVFKKAREILMAFDRQRLDDIEREARERFPNNAENQQTFITRAGRDHCPFTVNLMLHSMGNYVFKQVMNSSAYDGHHLLFDNVIMVAADVNNHDHARWVDRINCRRRIYITINEDDSALRASRKKPGEEQLARLGHYPGNLNSTRAVYVDFTSAPQVEDSHAYFEGDAVKDRDGGAFRFFHGALNGERMERYFPYDAAKNLYRVG